jgi:crossover junction endodeoxyribonuclease RuvC
MRILGIDPGLNITGMGIVEVDGDRCRHLYHGVLRTKPAAPLAERLVIIRDGVRDLALQFAIADAAVETSFVANNARSAMILGHARAAAIVGLADAGVAVHEYAPNLVKQTVTGYGHGEKAQVGEMVRMQLELKTTPTPADAADALAIAITHWAHARIANRLQPASHRPSPGVHRVSLPSPAPPPGRP